MATLISLSHLDWLRITCGGYRRSREIPSRFMAMMSGGGSTTEYITLPSALPYLPLSRQNKVEILAGQVDINGEYFVYIEDRVTKGLF